MWHRCPGHYRSREVTEGSPELRTPNPLTALITTAPPRHETCYDTNTVLVGYRSGTGNCFCNETSLFTPELLRTTVQDRGRNESERHLLERTQARGPRAGSDQVAPAVLAQYQVLRHNMASLDYDVCMMEHGGLFPR